MARVTVSPNAVGHSNLPMTVSRAIPNSMNWLLGSATECVFSRIKSPSATARVHNGVMISSRRGIGDFSRRYEIDEATPIRESCPHTCHSESRVPIIENC